jgi:hypothetical protein
MTENLPAAHAPQTHDQVAHMLSSLRQRQGSLIESNAESFELRQLVEALSEPATPMQRGRQIATLMAHYYVAEMPGGVHDEILSDFAVALREFPAWAIAEARRWWVNDNPKRHRRPLPGDLADRARLAMRDVYAAQERLKRLESDDYDAVVDALIANAGDVGLVGALDGARYDGGQIVCATAFRKARADDKRAELERIGGRLGIEISGVSVAQ